MVALVFSHESVYPCPSIRSSSCAGVCVCVCMWLCTERIAQQYVMCICRWHWWQVCRFPPELHQNLISRQVYKLISLRHMHIASRTVVQLILTLAHWCDASISGAMRPSVHTTRPHPHMSIRRDVSYRSMCQELFSSRYFFPCLNWMNCHVVFGHFLTPLTCVIYWEHCTTHISARASPTVSSRRTGTFSCWCPRHGTARRPSWHIEPRIKIKPKTAITAGHHTTTLATLTHAHRQMSMHCIL